MFIANWSPHRAYLRPETTGRPEEPERAGRVDLWSMRADFGLKMADFGPKNGDSASERANFEPERDDFMVKRIDLSLSGLIPGLKEPDLGLQGLEREGCTYEHLDRRKKIYLYVQSYWTSALWGRCSKTPSLKARNSSLREKIQASKLKSRHYV